MTENLGNTEEPIRDVAYYAQMLGPQSAELTPEQSAVSSEAGATALAGAEVSVEDAAVRSGNIVRLPKQTGQRAPIVIENPGPKAYREAGLTPGGARFGVDPTKES